jgi:hypothetical protein
MGVLRFFPISLLVLAAPVVAGGGEPTAGNVERFSREAVQQVVEQHRGEIQGCYEASLAEKNANRRQARAGRVVMSWTITPEGHVRNVEVKKTSLRDRDVTTCMAGAIALWEFPPPGRPQPILFPFELKPTNGVEKTGKR